MESQVSKRASNAKPERVEDDSAMGSCVGGLIWVLSMLLICCTFPFSLCVTIKQVQVCYYFYISNREFIKFYSFFLAYFYRYRN